MRSRAIILAAALAVAFGRPALAQGVSLGSGVGGQPVEILASEGIEWHRETQRYIARGDAQAKQGDTTVAADVLTAYYRAKAEGGTEIFRYEAQGRTVITTPTQSATGEKGIYDVDSGVLVLTGKNLKLVTPTDVITARDSLEYWEARRIAVARGDSLVVTGERRMKGDLLTAYFVDAQTNPPPPRPGATPTARAAAPAPQVMPASTGANASQHNRVQRIEGFGSVQVSTATEIVRGDRGVYNVDTGIALLANNVRITRGDNQMNGDFAEVNMNTGISRLLARPDSGGDKRVRGLLVPEKRADAGAKTPLPTLPGPPPPRPDR